MKLWVSGFGLMLSSTFVHAGTLTGAEVLKKCQGAYDTVRSFEEDVSGVISNQTATAHISFVRPGNLRVAGKTLFGTPYQLLVSKGKTWVFNNGSWEASQSPEMGIATITGISANAGTYVPSALFHASWGSLSGLQNSKLTVKSETIGGRATYRVTATQPYTTSLWIDAKTFFLVQTKSELMGHTLEVRFAPPKVNKAIPASRFAK